MENNKEDIILVCACLSSEHQLVFKSEISDKDSEVYVDIHLVPLPFLERVKYALKYIFGYKCKYGAFDEFLFKKAHADKLREIANRLDILNND